MSPKLTPRSKDNERSERPDAFRAGNLGPGMFITPRAKASARRACRAILERGFVAEISVDKRRVYKRRFEVIANDFWADRDYDNRMSLSEIKVIIRGVEKDLRSLLTRLDALPRDARRVVNEKWVWDKRDRTYSDYLGTTRTNLLDLKRAINGIIEQNYQKGSSTAVSHCCVALWKLREEVTGRAFRRNFQAAKGDAADEFVSPDARFVQLIVSAFDQSIGFQTIRTQLMALARQKTRPTTKP